MTSSGGAAALATDAAIEAGLRVDIPSPELQAVLKPALPAFGSTANPIDLTGALLTEPSRLDRVLSEIVPAAEIDMLLVVLGNADRCADALVEAIRGSYGGTGKPFAVAWSGGSGRPRRALLDHGIPTYSEPLRAVRALARVADFSLHG
jgi:acyl-CoA synthetase (NDP forming)